MPQSRPAHVLRAVLLIAVLALTLALNIAPASARSGGAGKRAQATKRAITHRRARAADALPAEGVFDSCNLGGDLAACEHDLLQMHQAGLSVAVVGAEWNPLDKMAAYAAYAQSIGMSVMWQLNDPGFWGGTWIGSNAAGDWTAFSSACACSGTVPVLDYMIHWLSALPATYGYYAADDYTLTPGQLGGLRQYVNEIKAADPAHMVMVGSSQSQGTRYYASGATIGNEIYPETTSSLAPFGRNLAAWDSVQQSVSQDQRAATAAGTSSAFILQAFTFGDNLDDGEAVGVCTPNMSPARCAARLQYPSAAVQLELRNQVLAHAHAKLILWYTFSEATQGDHWSALRNAVGAPYPANASAARARRASGRRHARHRRAVHRRHRAHRLSV